MTEKALLGLATTEDLLRELLARAEVQYAGGDQVVLRATADALLKCLSRPALDYRTAEPVVGHARTAAEAISGLHEAEFQLRSMKHQTLISEPELPALIARDVAKGRQALERIAGAVSGALGEVDLSPLGSIPHDIRDRILRMRDALKG